MTDNPKEQEIDEILNNLRAYNRSPVELKWLSHLQFSLVIKMTILLEESRLKLMAIG